MGQGAHKDPRWNLAKKGQVMTTAAVLFWWASDVGISSPEVDVDVEWVDSMVVKGKGFTDNLLGCRALFHYLLIV